MSQTCRQRRMERHPVARNASGTPSCRAPRQDDELVRRERRCDLAACRNADVVLATTLRVQLRANVYARVFTARADPANTDGLAKASADIPGTATSDLSTNSLGSGAASRREPAPPVALVSPSLGHQITEARDKSGSKPIWY